MEVGLLSFKLSNLSSGETAFLMLFSSLASAFSKIEKRANEQPVIILIDEGEMFLHPSWQRNYLSNLLEFISKFPVLSQRTHLFISTHSLIVAADAPPNTLFDVQAGKLRNGFGLGPKAILSEVYHVDRFAGIIVSQLIDQLTEYLRNPLTPNSNDILKLGEALADEELQRYVIREFDRRSGK